MNNHHAALPGLLQAHKAAKALHDSVAGLLALKRDAAFPEASYVRVSHPRYKGIGVVAFHAGDVPVGMLPVTLGNGNTWWYEIETCRPADACDKKAVPRELARIKRITAREAGKRRRILAKVNEELAKGA